MTLPKGRDVHDTCHHRGETDNGSHQVTSLTTLDSQKPKISASDHHAPPGFLGSHHMAWPCICVMAHQAEWPTRQCLLPPIQSYPVWGCMALCVTQQLGQHLVFQDLPRLSNSKITSRKAHCPLQKRRLGHIDRDHCSPGLGGLLAPSEF